MNLFVTIPFVVFASIAFGVVYTILLLLLNKVNLVKVSFLPLFIFSTLMYCIATILIGYFYVANNAAPVISL
ncbi:MAG: hypothetical protein LBB93_02555 [Elusimicrobiota bacterium]|nr:hypothetical protein [Elusimicrobiota bacterium]